MRHGTRCERHRLVRPPRPVTSDATRHGSRDTPPNRLPASTAVLDRVGLGADVKHDLQVRGSDALAAIILRLDAEERTELSESPAGPKRAREQQAALVRPTPRPESSDAMGHWYQQAPAMSDPPVRIRRTQFATVTNERHWGDSTLVVGMVES